MMLNTIDLDVKGGKDGLRNWDRLWGESRAEWPSYGM